MDVWHSLAQGVGLDVAVRFGVGRKGARARAKLGLAHNLLLAVGSAINPGTGQASWAERRVWVDAATGVRRDVIGGVTVLVGRDSGLRSVRAFAWGRMVERWLLGLLAAAAVAVIVGLLAAFWVRVPYPGELEWMEGGMLGHVLRILDGQPLYVAPNVDFTPYIYPPLFSLAGALTSWVVGPSVVALRLVSVLSTVVSWAVIFDFVRRHGSSAAGAERGQPTRWTWLPGVVAAGLFGLSFELGGAWFDVARVDSLFVGCLLLGCHLLLNFESRMTSALAALAMIGAFLTKQNGGVSAAVLVGYGFLQFDARHRLFAVTTIVGICASVGLMHWGSGGWSSYYLFRLPAHHVVLKPWITDFFRLDMWGAMALPAMVALFAVVERCNGEATAGQTEPRLRRRVDLLAVLLVFVLPAWMARFHSGMYSNVLMPLHAGVALLAGVGLAESRGQRSFRISASVALLVVFWSLDIDFAKHKPGAERQASWDELSKVMAQLPERTWVVENQGFAVPKGRAVGAQGMALIDVLRDDRKESLAPYLREHTRQMLERHHFDAIVVSGRSSSSEWFWKDLNRHYRLQQQLDGPKMLTGANVNHVQIWRAKGLAGE